ncbi:MAG: hypothetical protein HKN93_07125 [Acidimicrobiia bacterium]|nr:hypothetical protein [Acidimicrobiia bacterium]
MHRVIALIIAMLMIAAPAVAQEPTDVIVTSSLCCLTADGAGPDVLTYSVWNSGETTITAFEVGITLPPGTVGDPAIDVWVIDELAAGESADLVIALTPDVQVLGTTIEAPAAAITQSGTRSAASAMLPAWLRIL